MRLQTIKLAGFKSFVDPTTIKFVSNLTSIVGPNGCGKSNVIDAVCWVMGESSPKNLRSGASTDVIFSGSSTRKPVGQASVELLFSNVEGKLGGEYASYAEISIKRLVTRDGQSQYFLNNQRCRRKDIIDIFLGTGLGPRSYSIIGQGMISKIIEAKPEDLRTFIEEAAGISKYKERRRETENRIHHTKENLARLQDLQGELEKQLKHLERQSEMATRYQALKVTEKRLSAELSALAWQRLDRDIAHHENDIRDSLTQLAAQQASSQQLKTAQEKQRLLHTQVNDQLNDIQKRYYGVGSEIARIEQALAHQEERRIQLTTDQQEAQQTLQMTEALLEKDKMMAEALEEKMAYSLPLYEESADKMKMAQAVAEETEQTLESWREQVAELSQAILAPTRTAEAEKAKIAHLEKQSQQIQDRTQRLETEYQALPKEQSIESEMLAEKIEDWKEKREECRIALEKIEIDKKAQQQTLHALQSQLKTTQQRIHEAQGQLSALATLQASALGEQDEYKKKWMQARGWDPSDIIARILRVKPGWELAVETVLEAFLEAVCVKPGAMTSFVSEIGEPHPIGMCLVESSVEEEDNVASSSLLHYVESHNLPRVIKALLAKVQVANTMEEARAWLATGEITGSVITPEGHWLGQGWLKLKAKGHDPEGGVLAREEKIQQLTARLEEDEQTVQHYLEEMEECQAVLAQLETQKEKSQQDNHHLQQQIMSMQSEQAIQKNKQEQAHKRRDTIQQELLECHNILQEAHVEVNMSRERLHEALDKMAQYSDEQTHLTEQKQALVEAVSAARLAAKQVVSDNNAMALQIQTYRTQLEAVKANRERLVTQIGTAQLKLSNVVNALANLAEPVEALKEGLGIHLEKRLILEEELTLARDNVAGVDHEMRELERKLASYERTIDEWREKNESVKMQWQALTVHRDNVMEKLRSLEVVLEAVLKDMPEEAEESLWQTRLSEVEQKIQRLGPINLAAIEEHGAALERKNHLDAQLSDLNEALMTLENAIKKIDKETRAKFKETFDKVNEGFEKLFPKLFGGGQASLAMTGEDLLDTGVSLMARPPGKKNSTIQQLSGGEKALTAVALVFAIFELNPAPFCMLDEVDAPLDDNNVGRFCNLVREMSKVVQFIYVSHNKLAMEMAEQLQGVTMREPGVSRLVTVDLEEAKSLAQA